MEQKEFRNTRVLIAENMVQMRNVIRSMLRNLGFPAVLMADDGGQAWDMLYEGERVDMIISAWNMPNMTGIELLDQIRASSRYETLPFIMITGEITDSSPVKEVESEVDAFLVKPFTQEKLEEILRDVLDNASGNSPYNKLINAASFLLNGSRPDEAKKYIKGAISLNAKKPLGHFYLGQMHEKKGEIVEAKASYRQAISLGPRHLRSLEALMRIYASQKKEKKVLQTLKKIVKLTPRDLARHLDLGRLAFKLGQRHTGREALRKAILLDPDNISMVLDCISILIDNGVVREAERIIDNYAKKYPDDPAFLNRLGELYMQKGNPNKARDYYIKSLEMNKKDPNVHLNLARVYIGTGIKRLAKDHLEAAVRLQPSFAEAQNALASLDQLIHLARTSQAEENNDLMK